MAQSGKATIYSVAARANVSIATVSRTLSGADRVSEASRQRVLEAVRTLGYIPDGAARSLAAKRHQTLGLVLPELNGYYYPELLAGFESLAAEQRLSVVLLVTGLDGRDLDEPLADLCSRVDALAVMNGAGLIGSERLSAIRRHTPTVAIGGAPGQPDSVCTGNRDNARRLTTHLLEHGRRRLVFAGSPELAVDVTARWQGFAEALEGFGLAVPDAQPGGFDVDSGRALGTRIGNGELGCDAVVCMNDDVALGLHLELRRRGVVVPTDVAITGWGRGTRHPVHHPWHHHSRPARPGTRTGCGVPAGGEDRRPAGRRLLRTGHDDHSAWLVRLSRHSTASIPPGGRPEGDLMKIRVIAAALLASGLALSGCGRSDSGTASGPATGSAVATASVTGDLTMWAMGAEGQNLPELLKDFTAANPGINVKVTAIPWASAHDKFANAITAGTTPDIAMVGTTWMGEFAELDALDPTPGNIDKAKFFQGAQATTEVGGTSLGVPWYVETRLVFYRKDLAAKAGLTEPPKDWDAFKAFVTKMKGVSGVKYPISLQPGGDGSWQSVMPFAWSNGAELASGDTWTWTPHRWPRPGPTTRASSAKDWPTRRLPPAQIEADFVSGKVPMFVSGPWDDERGGEDRRFRVR